MKFEDVVVECLMTKELVEQFNRLYNHKLLTPRSPIETQINKSCNYDPNHEAMSDF